MSGLVRRPMVWAVDGPGSRWQGKPALAVAFGLMISPVVLNVALMSLFGYGSGDPAYQFMTYLTIVSWAIAGIYLAGLLVFGGFRLVQTVRDLLVQVMKKKHGRG